MFGSFLSLAQRLGEAQKKFLIPGLLVVVLILSQTGCSPFFSASANDAAVQEDVQEAVAATMVAFYVQATQSAAKMASSPEAPTAEPPTPTPTAIPVEPSPTEVPPQPTVEIPPTSPPAPAIITVSPLVVSNTTLPTIWAEVNTNCRYGPSIKYVVVGYLTVGITSIVHGSDTYKQWWYIENPQKTGSYCWVWSQSTHVDGDVSAVPVVAASSSPAPATYPWYGYGYGYNYTSGYGYDPGYGYYPYGYGCTYGYGSSPCDCNYKCYYPCQKKKIECTPKKKWCAPIYKYQCQKVCVNLCYQGTPCYTPFTEVKWPASCPAGGCTISWCKKHPGVCDW